MGNLAQNQLRILKQGRSLKTKFEAMHNVNMTRQNIRQVLAESKKTSTSDLALTTKAILLRSQQGDFEEAFEMANWSLKETENVRKVVVSNWIKNKQSVFFVHQMARMKRNDATTLMKDYFNEGGNINDVAEWFATAGNILKTGNLPGETDGLWGWVKDAAEGAVDAIKGAINTVADAVKAAGKNLTEAIATVAGWTQSKINDFVEAVIATGKSVGSILSEAVKKGTATLNKFITAAIEAGVKGLEILTWAVTKAGSMLKNVLQRLEQIFGSFTTLLLEIAKLAASSIAIIVRALLEMGKAVRDFILRLERIAYQTARLIVMEIRKAGKAISEIMAPLLNKSRYLARIVLDGLLMLKNSISNLLKQVINWTATQLSVLVGALKDLGRSLGQVLDAVATFAGEQIVKLMQAVRIIWTKIKDILEFIAQKAENTLQTLLVALLGTGLHLVKVLECILKEVRAAFRQGLIKGLIQIGYSMLVLMVEAFKIGASMTAVLFSIFMDIFGSHRGLTAAERAEAEKVFGTSIELNKVRLTNASLPSDLIMWLNQNRPFTTMYVINYKSGTNLSIRTLIHELTHIWQAEKSGGVYMLEALHSQFFGKAYKLTDVDVIDAAGQLSNLEREQQAVLVEEYWRGQFNGESIPLTLDLIRPLARQVYESRLIVNPIRLVDFGVITNRVFNPVRPVVPQ